MTLDETQAIEAYIDTPKTLAFYQKAFEKYTVTGISQFAWHWAWWAMFGGVFYLLYRKLYLEALGYFILFATVGMVPFVGLIMWVVSGGVLPYLVYKRYQKTKEQVEMHLTGEEVKLAALRMTGGVNTWAIWLGVALHVIMWISILYMAIMMSAIPR